MSSHKTGSSSKTGLRRALTAIMLVAGLAGVAGCTVRPLYSDAALETGSLSGGETMKSALASVAVKPASNRVELEVRNHLIFLLGGDGSMPAAPRYMVEQNVISATAGSALVQRTVESEPTARQVMVTAAYRLTEIETGKIIGSGRPSITASFDVPQQEFAALRAERDAQNRAAREVAELLRHSIARDLAKVQPAG